MLPFLFLAGLFLLTCVLITSAIIRQFKQRIPGIDEPAGIPPSMGWALSIGVVALNVFTYDVGFGIGYGLFGAAAFIAAFLVFPESKRTADVWLFTVTGIICCLFFGFRANEFVQVVNVVAAFLCFAALALIHSADRLQWHGLWFLKMIGGYLARFVHHPFSLGSALRQKTSSRGAMLLTILKTVGLTLVVVLFFSWILSSADPVFDNLIREIREQVLGRTLLSTFFIVLFLAGLTVRVPGSWQQKVPQLKIFSFMEVFVPALSLAILFGIFLGVQAKYLFASHDVFQALGITYSDYVRRGFIELLIACFFGSILTYGLILKQHALADAAKILKLKWVNGLLLIELLLLLASAAKRDWMYVEMYGLTRVRIIGAIFLLWLLGIIVLILALNFLKAMNEKKLFVGAASLSAAVVLVLNMFNIDQFIALSQPPRDERPDIVYMSRLSSDAVDGWLMAMDESAMRYETLRAKTSFTEEEKQSLADMKIAIATFQQQIARLEEPRKWQEKNWSHAHALQRINATGYRPLQLARCLFIGIQNIESFAAVDVSQLVFKRLHDYYSPFMFSDFWYEPDVLTKNSSEPVVPQSCSSGQSQLPMIYELSMSKKVAT